MTVYTECEECRNWVIEREMDYFTGIGNVCPICSNEMRSKKPENKEKPK